MKIGGKAREIIDEFKRDPMACVKQIEFCEYETEGSCLKNNVAWIAIKELIQEKHGGIK